MLKEKMSPEQISGRLLKIKAIRISYESIYQYMWDDKKNGGDLYKHLRQQGKKGISVEANLLTEVLLLNAQI